MKAVHFNLAICNCTTVILLDLDSYKTIICCVSSVASRGYYNQDDQASCWQEKMSVHKNWKDAIFQSDCKNNHRVSLGAHLAQQQRMSEENKKQSKSAVLLGHVLHPGRAQTPAARILCS